jgi:hypothetical protein
MPRRATILVDEFDELFFAWDEAQVEAYLAYEAWRRHPGAEAYLVYRATQDRADAAEYALIGYAKRDTGGRELL